MVNGCSSYRNWTTSVLSRFLVDSSAPRFYMIGIDRDAHGTTSTSNDFILGRFEHEDARWRQSYLFAGQSHLRTIWF